jgi:hypothetical protein
LQWLIGDWWRFGAYRYGERKQAVEGWGWLAVETVQNYGHVCAKFETSRRREVLSFSHHAAVASLDPAEADALLDWVVAEGGRRSVAALRHEVNRRQSERFRLVGKVTVAPLPPSRPIVTETTMGDLAWFSRALRQVQTAPAPPPLRLDTSGVSGAVPAELAEVREAPPEPPMLDHAAIAHAVLSRLPFDEAFAVVSAWADGFGYDLIERP